MSPPGPSESGRALRATLLIGGGLLIASGLVQVASYLTPVSGLDVVELWVAPLAFAAAMTVFAWGVGREGSLVARRPLGVTALIAFGIAPWLLMIAFSFVPGGPGPGILLFLVVQLVSFVSGLVAVLAIIRARVLPRGWRQVPLWAFILAALAHVAQLSLIGVMSWEVIVALPLVIPGVMFTLGVLAVVLGARSAPRPVAADDAERGTVGRA